MNPKTKARTAADIAMTIALRLMPYELIGQAAQAFMDEKGVLCILPAPSFRGHAIKTDRDFHRNL